MISGRNKPSFDFLQKTLKAFPGLNADWLIQGEGTMYEHMGREMPGSLFDEPETPHEGPSHDDIQEHSEDTVQIKDTEQAVKEPEPVENEPALTDEPVESLKIDNKRKIVQVMVFYDDDTFRSFKPSE